MAVRSDAAERLVQDARSASGPLEAASIADQAASQIPGELHSLLEIGNAARERGAFASAERLYAHVLERSPTNLFAPYELAVSRQVQGRHEDALVWLGRLLDQRPADGRGNLLAARLHYVHGRRSEGDAHLAAIPAGEAAPQEIAAVREFGAFMTAWPQAETLAMVRGLERRYLGADVVTEQAAARLAAGEGFALIRLGDGEGAFLQSSEAEELAYAALYAANRDDRANVWFAGGLDLMRSGFTAEMAGLAEAVERTDVVGAPYASWLEHEYMIASITGVTSLVNALRLVAGGPTDRALTRQTVHIEMHNHGLIEQLLRGRRRVGVIACHPQLPARLTESFGFEAVEFHKLPGEKLMADRIGAEAAAGSHYPHVFREVMAALDRPLGGQLFLVAGGILGKFYCDRIRRSGGVALDIGSLADAWVGAATRPGYEQLRPLQA